MTVRKHAGLREPLRRLLAHEAGANADGKAVAAASQRLYEALASQLNPLIGSGGVNAIYGRSLHLTKAEFPWLAIRGESEQNDPTFSPVRVCLERQEYAAAIAGASAVFATVGGLLVTFIGDGLTARVLRDAWPAEFASDTPQAPTT